EEQGRDRPEQGSSGPQGRRRRRARRRVRRGEGQGQHRDARCLRRMPPLATGLRLRDRRADPPRSPRGPRHRGRL
ncbi:MAG: hypothetical protein AVDCRST_MAG25-2383, partial [uncultured Rubrobacteraceae bacterium]